MMADSLQKNQGIEYDICVEIKYAIFNKSAFGLNQLINKLDLDSKRYILHYLTSKNLPFSRHAFAYGRIKFDTIKALKFLKLLNKRVTLTDELLMHLWIKVSAQLKDTSFTHIKYNDIEKIDRKNIYEYINEQYVIKNNLSISNDSYNNIEYGPQGIPSQKRSRYKLRNRRK